MNKEIALLKPNNIIQKLRVLAREKEVIRRKLAVTAEKLRLKARKLAVTAREKEVIRKKLAVTTGKLKKLYATLGRECTTGRKIWKMPG